MYLGQDHGDRAGRTRSSRSPHHPYTAALVSVSPTPDPPSSGGPRRARSSSARRRTRPRIPTGCRFHPRCPLAFDRCTTEEPPLFDVGGGQSAACWLAEGGRSLPVMPGTPVVPHIGRADSPGVAASPETAAVEDPRHDRRPASPAIAALDAGDRSPTCSPRAPRPCVAELTALGADGGWRPEPGEWSANECVGHLIEAERRGFAGRIRTILVGGPGGSVPAIPPDLEDVGPAGRRRGPTRRPARRGRARRGVRRAARGRRRARPRARAGRPGPASACTPRSGRCGWTSCSASGSTTTGTTSARCSAVTPGAGVGSDGQRPAVQPRGPVAALTAARRGRGPVGHRDAVHGYAPSPRGGAFSRVMHLGCISRADDGSTTCRYAAEVHRHGGRAPGAERAYRRAPTSAGRVPRHAGAGTPDGSGRGRLLRAAIDEAPGAPADDPADDRPDEVDPQVAQVAADDRRPDGTGRVDRRAAQASRWRSGSPPA